jgi:hypothetical protein
MAAVNVFANSTIGSSIQFGMNEGVWQATCVGFGTFVISASTNGAFFKSKISIKKDH